MVADKFLDIKHLNIRLGEDDDDAVTPTYDYLSLASFLDACPVLESFTLSVDQSDMQHDSVFGDPSLGLRQILQHKHERLKKVRGRLVILLGVVPQNPVNAGSGAEL